MAGLAFLCVRGRYAHSFGRTPQPLWCSWWRRGRVELPVYSCCYVTIEKSTRMLAQFYLLSPQVHHRLTSKAARDVHFSNLSRTLRYTLVVHPWCCTPSHIGASARTRLGLRTLLSLLPETYYGD